MYYDNWGEMLNENSVPVLCVLDVDTNEISVPGGIPGHISPGQVSALHCGKSVGNCCPCHISQAKGKL